MATLTDIISSRRTLSIVLSFVLTMAIVSLFGSMYVLWQSYNTKHVENRIQQSMVTKTREWVVVMQWSTTINNTLLNSNLPRDSIQYFVDLNLPAIERLTDIQQFVTEHERSIHGIHLLERIEVARTRWLTTLHIVNTQRVSDQPMTVREENEYRAARSRLLHHAQDYNMLLLEYLHHVEETQLKAIRSAHARLAVMLLSVALAAIVMIAVFSRRLFERLDQVSTQS